MGDQLDLVGARAIQLAAVDHLKVLGKAKVPGNLLGKYRRFAGGDIQRALLALQQLQQLAHAIEQLILIQTHLTETLAVMVHRLPGRSLVELIRLHKTLQQRRADKVLQRLQIRLVDTQFGQRMLH